MLLGTTHHDHASPDMDFLIPQLILQARHAEAYGLLISLQPARTATLYNIALCLHWSGNYQAALEHLEQIQLPHRAMSEQNKLAADANYTRIRAQQNQFPDYLNGISESYLNHFPSSVYDAIIRLKTDCWLALGNFQKVIATDSPIAHKGFKDINEALNLARASHDDTFQ